VRDAIDAAEDADDKGTADLFTDMVRDLDKYLWFLEAHLQS
jgi:starvation-inducible DNA-binding protein